MKLRLVAPAGNMQLQLSNHCSATESAVPMDTENAISAMKAIIAEERAKGCPMADDLFIEPGLRRWRSYDRRFKRHKDTSLEHRAHDLEKGLLDWYVEHHGYGYDPGCIHHLAYSFARILFGSAEASSESVSKHSV